MTERTRDEEITGWALAAGRGDRDALACFVRATQRDVHRLVGHLSSPSPLRSRCARAVVVRPDPAD